MRKGKLFLEAGEKPLIYYAIMAFHDRPDMGSITIVTSPDSKEKIKELVKKYRFPRVTKIVVGGKTRQSSLKKGLLAVSKSAKKDDTILVHNGANPLPSYEEISQVIKKTEEHGACIVGHYLNSTIKEIKGGHIIKTRDRKKLFAAETPQATKYEILKKAVEEADKTGFKATDEAMLLENIGQKVACVEADPNNFKITTPADHERLKNILGDPPEGYRIGIGQDSHMFEDEIQEAKRSKKKECLILGGVKIQDMPKLEANSDGDVVLHAIFNAISQALGKKSIGFYADEQCEKGIKDSKKYVETILKEMRKEGFEVNSLGLMMECKKPQIDKLSAKIKKSLSAILSLKTHRIGITATSGEDLTAFGKGLGIQCFAIVSLKKIIKQ